MKVRINESQLRNLISECVKKTLNEWYHKSFDDGSTEWALFRHNNDDHYYKEIEPGDEDNPEFDSDGFSQQPIVREDNAKVEKWKNTKLIPDAAVQKLDNMLQTFAAKYGKSYNHNNLVMNKEEGETCVKLDESKFNYDTRQETPIYAKAIEYYIRFPWTKEKIFGYAPPFVKQLEADRLKKRAALDQEFAQLLKEIEGIGFKMEVDFMYRDRDFGYGKVVRFVWQDEKTFLRWKDVRTERKAWFKYEEPEEEPEEDNSSIWNNLNNDNDYDPNPDRLVRWD